MRTFTFAAIQRPRNSSPDEILVHIPISCHRPQALTGLSDVVAYVCRPYERGSASWAPLSPSLHTSRRPEFTQIADLIAYATPMHAVPAAWPLGPYAVRKNYLSSTVKRIRLTFLSNVVAYPCRHSRTEDRHHGHPLKPSLHTPSRRPKVSAARVSRRPSETSETSETSEPPAKTGSGNCGKCGN
jgi:hypothetical protein